MTIAVRRVVNTCLAVGVGLAVVLAGVPDVLAQGRKLRCRDCVRSRQIKDREVMTADIAQGAVTSEEILDGTVAGADIAAGAISKSKLASDVRAVGFHGVVALAAGAFAMDRNNGCHFDGDGNWQGDGVDICCLHTGVMLPHGTTITGFEATFLDTDASGQFEIELRRQDLRDGSQSVELSQIFSEDGPAVQVASGSTIHHEVDAEHFGYFVSLCLPRAAGAFHGARVLFE